MKRKMSKDDYARLITTFIQSQVGVRELGTRPMICVPGAFFSMRSRVKLEFLVKRISIEPKTAIMQMNAALTQA